MIKQAPETEDPALYGLPLITSGLYVFCAYLPTRSQHLIAASSYFFSCGSVSIKPLGSAPRKDGRRTLGIHVE